MKNPVYYTVWPDEAEILKNADQEKLVETIGRMDLARDTSEKRPLRLRIPQPLRDALDTAAALGHKKVDVLLSAAREYRRRHPWEPGWEETPAPAENEQKGGERKGIVFRLSPADRDLLRNIGRGCSHVSNRYEALLELAPIIRAMDLCDFSARKRISVYLPLTQELQEVLERQHAETQIPRVQILLKAISHLQFREQDHGSQFRGE